MENILRFEYNKGEQSVYPEHKMINNWLFSEEEHDEVSLAYYVAKVAEKNGLSVNDVMHVFPPILRMLKSNIPWSE